MSIIHRPYDDQIVALQKEINRLYSTMIHDEDISILDKLEYAHKIRQIGMIVQPKDNGHEIHHDNRHNGIAEYIPKP